MALCTLTAGGCDASGLADDELVGKVIRVADGDTITIQTPIGDQEKIRLFGIDAPERGQAFGRKSQRALADLVAGRTVTVLIQDEDPYGRLVGVVYADDETDVNAKMVDLGLAWVYRRYTNDPELIELEEDARDAGRGLWRDPDPLPPHVWRARNPR
ncbi:MAG: thermonuclease family protein [bacterium]|nr:thermonuclease family protein [bacterium]